MATSSKVHALDPTVQPTLQASRSNTPRLSSDTVARYAPVSSAQPAARKAPDTGKPPVGLALQAVAAAEHKLPRTSTGPAVASAHVHATADAAQAMGIGAGMRMQRPSVPCADASGATARRTAAASSLQEVSPAPPKACTSILLASGRWSHTASLPAAAGGSSAQEPSSRSVHAAKACSTSVAQGPASLPADAAAESASPPPAVTSLLSLSPPRTVRHSPTAPDPDVLRSPVLSQGAVLSPHARVRMVCKPPRDAPAAAAVATSPAQITNSKSDNSCVLPGSKRATVGHATLAASPIQSSHLSFPEEQAGESCNLHASISVNQDEQTSSTEPTTAPPHTCSKRAAAAAAPAAPCNDQHATDHAASSVPGCWKEGWASNAHGSVDAVDLDMYEGWELTVPELDPASGTQACHPLPDLASIAGRLLQVPVSSQHGSRPQLTTAQRVQHQRALLKPVAVAAVKGLPRAPSGGAHPGCPQAAATAGGTGSAVFARTLTQTLSDYDLGCSGSRAGDQIGSASRLEREDLALLRRERRQGQVLGRQALVAQGL
ncbi:MAG: hypothetical protein WDW36_000713 [Sanguina aurantia]